MGLNGFEESMENCNEKILEAIQMAWLEEFEDRVDDALSGSVDVVVDGKSDESQAHVSRPTEVSRDAAQPMSGGRVMQGNVVEGSLDVPLFQLEEHRVPNLPIG